jgi:hypothetical protein
MIWLIIIIIISIILLHIINFLFSSDSISSISLALAMHTFGIRLL